MTMVNSGLKGLRHILDCHNISLFHVAFDGVYNIQYSLICRVFFTESGRPPWLIRSNCGAKLRGAGFESRLVRIFVIWGGAYTVFQAV